MPTRKEFRYIKNSSQIQSLVFQKDTLISGDYDGMIKFWDIQTGDMKHSLKAHEHPIVSVQVDIQKKLIISADIQEAKIWDDNYNCLHLRELQGGIVGMAYSSYHSVVALCGVFALYKWNIKNNLLKQIPEVIAPKFVAFSSDGKNFASVSLNTISFWDSKIQKVISSISVFSNNIIDGISMGEIYSFTFSSNNKSVALGFYQEIVVIDIATGKETRFTDPNVRRITTIAFSNDNSLIALGNANSNIYLRNSKDLGILGILPKGAKNLALAINPYSGQKIEYANGETHLRPDIYYGLINNRMAYASLDQAGKIILKARNFFAGNHIAISKDTKTLAIAHARKIAIWDLEKAQVIINLVEHKEVTCVEFNEDQRYLVSCSWDKDIKIWDIPKKSQARFLSMKKEFRYEKEKTQITVSAAHNSTITGSDISSDGNILVSSDWDGNIKLWDVEKGIIINQFHHKNSTDVAFNREGTLVASSAWDGNIKLLDVEKGRNIATLTGHSGIVNSLVFGEDGLLYSTGEDTQVKIWDISNSKELLSLISTYEDYIAITPGGYYKSSKKGIQEVAFAIGERAFPFDQFDLQLNRPDIVLESLNKGNSELIQAYNKAYQRRIQRSGFTQTTLFSQELHLPTLKVTSKMISSTTQEEIAFSILAEDDQIPLQSIWVYVNGVSVYGKQGFAIIPKNLHSFTQTFHIKLSQGKNKVQVSAFNHKGQESLRETFEITCNKTKTPPNLFLATIGISKYKNSSNNLEYAAKDAEDVTRFFNNNKNFFGEVYSQKLLNQNATKQMILDIKDNLFAKSQVDDVAILFISGHGVLDKNYNYFFATRNTSFGSPGKEGLSYDDLENILDAIPARKRILFLDTCHSGEISEYLTFDQVKAEGAKGRFVGKPKIQDNSELIQELFSDLRRNSGTIVISSAYGWQAAYEDNNWKNSAFTDALLEGLENATADKDQDGVILISELQEFIGKKVQQLTNSRQTPNTRKENVDLDFVILGEQ